MLIEIYSKDDCVLCQNTKRYLTERNFNYIEYKIGQDISLEDVKAKFPTVKLLPVILVDGKLTESHSLMLLNEG